MSCTLPGVYNVQTFGAPYSGPSQRALNLRLYHKHTVGWNEVVEWETTDMDYGTRVGVLLSVYTFAGHLLWRGSMSAHAFPTAKQMAYELLSELLKHWKEAKMTK